MEPEKYRIYRTHSLDNQKEMMLQIHLKAICWRTFSFSVDAGLVLLRSSIDWMRSTHMWRVFCFKVHWFNLIKNTFTVTCRIMFDLVSFGSLKLTHRIYYCRVSKIENKQIQNKYHSKWKMLEAFTLKFWSNQNTDF